MEATTKDLRLHTRKLIAATDRGEEVIITYRGKRRAKLVPWTDAREAHKAKGVNPAFGLWQEHESGGLSVDQQVRALRQPRKRP